MKPSAKIFLLLVPAFSPPCLGRNANDIYSIPLDSLWNLKVSSASRFEEPIDKTPSSIIVITERQIESRGYQDLSDVLKDMPGFDITDNAARFGEFYTVRGIPGNERLLVLIDGHKINPPTGTLLSVGNSISVRFAKRIEMIYGPASAMYGADAYSGIINIISKDAYRGRTNLASAVSYGSNSSFDGMVESRSRLTDNLSLTVFARMFRSDGFNVVGFDTLFNIIKRYKPPLTPESEQPINDFTIFSRVNYRNFTLGYFRKMFDEGNASIESPLRNVYNSMDKWKTSTDNIWLSHKEEFRTFGTLNSDVNLVYFNTDKNSQFTKWVTPNDPSAYISQYALGSDLALRGNTNIHKVFSDGFQAISGIDYEHIRSIPPYASDQLFGQAYKYEGNVADSINEKMVATENRVAGFGQVDWSPVPALDLIIGGRYDYLYRYKGTFNPRLGFTYNPMRRTLLKFSYATAFQAPSLFYQYEQFGTPTDVMLSSVEVRERIDPGWRLKNQLAKTYELSFTQQFFESFQIKVSGYYNHLTDVIERVTFDPDFKTYNKYFDNLSRGIRNENIGVQTIRGVNTEVNYGISDAFESYIYYGYTDGTEETASGTADIPRISKNKIWIGATYNDLFGFLSLSPRIRWIGEMNNANKTAFPSGKQDGYTAIDLALSAGPLFGGLEIYAFFNNLLNRKIYHGGLYEQAGGHLAAVPQEGFHFQIGLQVNLAY